MKNNLKKRYCYACGTLEKTRHDGTFNIKNAEPNLEYYCPNLNCKTNCKHDFGFLNWSSTCKKCGYYIE